MTNEQEGVEKGGRITVVDDASASMLAIIANAARDPNIDVVKMERLMEMKLRMDAISAEEQFNQAMNEAQKKTSRIQADANNNQTHSKYATYAALDRVLRPVYTECGFSLSFDTGESSEGMVRVLCYVSHTAGHTRTYRADIPADGKGAKGGDVMTKTHAVGSGMSYGMRYLLKMIFNVAIGEDDDDGNSWGGKVEKAKSQAQIAWETTWNALKEEQRIFLNNLANEVIQILGTGDAEAARDKIATQNIDGDEMFALYGLFNKQARNSLGRAVFTKKEKQA